MRLALATVFDCQPLVQEIVVCIITVYYTYEKETDRECAAHIATSQILRGYLLVTRKRPPDQCQMRWKKSS